MIAAPPIPTSDLDPAFLAAFRGGTLTETQASEFAHRDPMQITFLLLALSAAVSMMGRPAVGPHTPSSALPPYAKPPGKRRKKKPGAKPGHTGHCRPTPERIDRVSDSTGSVQTSTFDLANRLTSRSLDAPTGGDLRVDFTYTDRNERQSMTRFSDLAGTTKVGDSSYTFDAGGRLTNLQNRTGSSAVIGDYAYQYDLDNRLT